METIGRRARPLGVTIIALIIGIFAAITLLGVILGLVGINLASNGGVLSTVAIVALVIVGIIALAELVTAWGLWTLKPWAFWTVVVVEIIRAATGLYSAFSQGNSLWSAIISVIIPLIVLIYLFADRNVRAAFHV